MTSRKPAQTLYIPPALRAEKSVAEAKKELSSDCPIQCASVNEQTDVLKQLESLTLSDDCNNNGGTVFKKKLFNQKSSRNDSNSEPVIRLEDFQHIIELYNFSKDFQTFHLEAELTGFNDSGFYLKWVDDTHCLAVFSSNNEADRALAQISGLFMKARRIKDASLASKLKIARSPGDWAMPYKKRPITTSSTARRLISNHLGIVSTKIKSPEDILKEKQDKALLQEARARAEAIRQAQKSLWEDD
ncbi:unnamed protein product [Schistosoma turkestanicum]|nr:unnamed protein product [Schistosoma turkestanicum]CAH8488286.1 unnamed protein product [Schistosoma turkestanicum]